MFLLHIHGYWLDNVRPPKLSGDGLLVRVMGFGGAGVDIFIVLSGFCLTLPLIRDGRVREPGTAAGSSADVPIVCSPPTTPRSCSS